jgi:hypothetical protein
MKIRSVKVCFEDMQDELDFAAKCLVGPSLRDKIFEILEIKKIKKIKDILKNELRPSKR